jgi:hypothetical protein
VHDELADANFTVIAVALDESPDDVRPWAEGITLPVLVDRQHLLTELYAISNVPTVVWIDEDDRIVRPNGVAFSTDMFTPEEARAAVPDLSDDEVRARLHFRIATEARRRGDDDVARRHFVRAGELAPTDFTIRRAAMPLMGGDPFGEEFMELYQEWEQLGSPFHGLQPMRD